MKYNWSNPPANGYAIFPKHPLHMREFLEVVTKYGTRKTMLSIGESFRHEVNRYIPVGDSRHLQEKGYELKAGITKNQGPYFRLTYRNTPEVPYVMYQYYGEVWGKNYAHWVPTMTLHKAYANPMSEHHTLNIQKSKLTKWEQVGWVSEKGVKKENTHRPLGVPRTIVLKNGKIIRIEGYKKKKPKPKPFWVEYFRNSARFTPWLDGTAALIARQVKNKYMEKLNR